MALRLRSKAFEAFEEIPRRYSGEGESVSPPLQWSGVPDGTHEFVLICEDPDAPTPSPFVHWLGYHLSANTTQLPEGLPQQERIEYPVLMSQGPNTLLKPGYTGPMPPLWHSPHHYEFRLFALNAELAVPEGAGRSEVFKAMKGHILEETRLVGYYERRFRKDARRILEDLKASRRSTRWLWAGASLVSASLLALAVRRVAALDARRLEVGQSAA
jgi:Raf kinase inhibitor-like YbhB/YbcL family protein